MAAFAALFEHLFSHTLLHGIWDSDSIRSSVPPLGDIGPHDVRLFRFAHNSQAHFELAFTASAYCFRYALLTLQCLAWELLLLSSDLFVTCVPHDLTASSANLE